MFHDDACEEPPVIRLQLSTAAIALLLVGMLGTGGLESSSAATTAPALMAPQPIAPANATVIGAAGAVLQWTAVEGAGTYDVRMSLEPERDLTTGALLDVATTQTGIDSTLLAVDGLGPDWLWWQVRAVDAAGTASAWSVVWGLRSSAEASTDSMTDGQLPTLPDDGGTVQAIPDPVAADAPTGGVPLWVILTAALVALVLAWFLLLWRNARQPS